MPLTGAMPATAAGHLPSTADQYRSLQSEIAKSRPVVNDAKQRSEALNSETEALRQRLIDTAARVQVLESEKLRLDHVIATMSQEERVLAASFSRQRTQVIELLAVLERMQHEVPPVMAIRADDALAAAHSSMLLGAALPRIYGATAELSHRLTALQRTRLELEHNRAQAAKNASALAAARGDLDQLLATKSKEAEAAGAKFADLASQLEAVSEKATNLDALLQRVAALRTAGAPQNSVIAAPHRFGARLVLLRPVMGQIEHGVGIPKAGPSGLNFLAAPAAEVVSPADSQVLFAGPYHKTGLVLILQTANGYDLVLAGLERVDVRAGDQLLAGEPVGRMPRAGAEARLYFELRQNGKGIDPMPWLEPRPGKVSRS